MNKLTIDDVPLKGKRVLVRVDFNVPLNEQRQITDDTRIAESLPTIRKILNEGGRPILMSHLGRPKGKPKPEFSLSPVAGPRAKVLGSCGQFAPGGVGAGSRRRAEGLKDG
ncbi:MAG: phosphoglycerate kinase, partial [Bacteroidota bacterium]